MSWYLEALKKYAQFSGRSRRKEYWYFTLFNMIVFAALLVVDLVFGLADAEAGVGVLSGLYILAVLLPGIAVSVRRLHDTGHSGWWLLISLIPLIGPIVLLVFMVSDSETGANKYGPSPKQEVLQPAAV